MELATWVIGGFSVALGGLVVTKLLNGTINTQYLLYGIRKDGTPYFSPERVQLMAVTLCRALNYPLTVLNNPHVQSLPDVNNQTLGVLAGSQMLCLGGKASSRFGPLVS
ncbi:MAG: hypothetical protein WBX26_09380 [Candidatus Cybelea sp.]